MEYLVGVTPTLQHVDWSPAAVGGVMSTVGASSLFVRICIVLLAGWSSLPHALSLTAAGVAGVAVGDVVLTAHHCELIKQSSLFCLFYA